MTHQPVQEGAQSAVAGPGVAVQSEAVQARHALHGSCLDLGRERGFSFYIPIILPRCRKNMNFLFIT